MQRLKTTPYTRFVLHALQVVSLGGMLLFGLPNATLAASSSAAIAVEPQNNDGNAFKDDSYDDEFDGEFADDFSNDEEAPLIKDPIESFNRAIFWFNDKLYFLVLKPVARFARFLPSPVRRSANHFFTNLEHPVYAVNSALQLKFRESGASLARFSINSTVGVLGLFDPAKHTFGIPMHKEDFGQTLGKYGAGPGFYLVIPFLGSSSFRDFIGLNIDYRLSLSHLTLDDDKNELIYHTVDTVNTLSLDKNSYELIKDTSLDPYLFVRDAYQQRRQTLIQQ